MRHHSLSILCACLMLAACGADKTLPPQQSDVDESLPQPDAAGGSVTGMPNPGKPAVLPPPADDVATGNEDLESATEEASTVDPSLPVTSPPTFTVEGSLGKPPTDTMPTMPAQPSESNAPSEISPPPES